MSDHLSLVQDRGLGTAPLPSHVNEMPYVWDRANLRFYPAGDDTWTRLWIQLVSNSILICGWCDTSEVSRSRTPNWCTELLLGPPNDRTSAQKTSKSTSEKMNAVHTENLLYTRETPMRISAFTTVRRQTRAFRAGTQLIVARCILVNHPL